VPKFVDVWTVHNGHGVPASNVPSATLSDGVHDGLAVGVAVFVEVKVGDGEAVAVFVGVPQLVVVVICSAQPPEIEPESMPRSSLT